MIQIDPLSATPIGTQIESAVRDLLASRRLVLGNAVPRVRDLAHPLATNRATAPTPIMTPGDRSERLPGGALATKPCTLASSTPRTSKPMPS